MLLHSEGRKDYFEMKERYRNFEFGNLSARVTKFVEIKKNVDTSK